jgi:hypothetical protein
MNYDDDDDNKIYYIIDPKKESEYFETILNYYGYDGGFNIEEKVKEDIKHIYEIHAKNQMNKYLLHNFCKYLIEKDYYPIVITRINDYHSIVLPYEFLIKYPPNKFDIIENDDIIEI